MQDLTAQHIYLRALEPEDLDFLYRLENDTSLWEISGTQKPYSRSILKDYLANAHLDIFEAKQLRFCICKKEGNQIIGLIDLFDFDPRNQRAGLGLVIESPNERQKGYGREALELVCQFAFDYLNTHQLYANILAENQQSIKLFESLGFKTAGVKKDWIFSGGIFKDEVLLQKIKGG